MVTEYQSSLGEPRHSSEHVQAKLMEYQQCFETYRYLYVTVWQQITVLAAISGIIFAFAGETGIQKLFGVDLYLIGWVPFIVWYFVLYRPSHRYAMLRAYLLIQMEDELNSWLTGANLRHMKASHSGGYTQEMTKYQKGLEWWRRPSLGLNVGTLIYFLIWVEVILVIQRFIGFGPEIGQGLLMLVGIPIAFWVAGRDQQVLIRTAKQTADASAPAEQSSHAEHVAPKNSE